LILLGLASTVTNLTNRFAQDDMPVVERNPIVHTLRSPLTFFTESYWPKPFPPALYRPLATSGFALQWAISRGAPWFFRATSILMYLAAGLAVYALARRLLPAAAAWLTAAFFLVHPVHVEAVAVAVNQSEIMVGLLSAAGTLVYLDARRREKLGTKAGIALFLIYLTACLYKESGVMMPGFLLAAELTLVPSTEPFRTRLLKIRPLFLTLLLGAVAFFALRTAALHGDTVGTFTAEALDGLSMGQRALTMLAVVPHWFRLMLWPAHLQGDYSPREIESALTWGTDQTFGAALLALAVFTLIAAWRRMPVISFGLFWVAIGIFPVSNVLVPTGIVLAERTLFLPSIGMMLMVGGFAALVVERLQTERPAVRWAAALVPAAILIMATTRSASRQRVWTDQFTFWHQTAIDAPLSYRAHHALAQLLFQVGQRREAESEYMMAIALYPKTWGPPFDLANKYRLAGLCDPAVPFYLRTLSMAPQQEAARAGLIACLVHLGRYEEAQHQARDGVSYATSPSRITMFQRFGRTADSAAAAGAKPGTVAIRLAPSDTLSLDP
jgi:hypothetical protein